MRRETRRGPALLVIAVALAACGGGSSPPRVEPSLTVSPESVTAYTGNPPMELTATLLNAAGPVTWTMSPQAGTLSPTSGAVVTYTPPALAAELEVVVTAQAAGLQKQIRIALRNPRIVVSPAPLVLQAGSAPSTFTATLEGIPGEVTRWYLSDPIGTLSATSGATTTYTPPATRSLPAQITLRAESYSAEKGLFAGTSTIIVQPPPRLAIAPRVSSIAAGGASVALDATLDYSNSPVTWTLAPAIGSLSATSGASVSYLPPPTIAATTPITVTATSGDLTAAATVFVAGPEGLQVDGTVRDPDGFPVSGAAVTVAGAAVVTGEDGRFAFAGVTPPYDAMLVVDGATTVYFGLSRPDPTLRGPRRLNGWGKIQGTLTGFTLGGSARAKVFFCARGSCAYSGTATAANPSFSFFLASHAPGISITGRVGAFEYVSDANGEVTEWGEYGEVLDVTVPLAATEGAVVPVSQDVALAAGRVRREDLKVNFSLPSGLSPSHVSIHHVFPEGEMYLTTVYPGTWPPMVVPVPLLAGGSIVAHGYSTGTNPGSNMKVGGITEWYWSQFGLMRPASLLTPSDDATLVSAATAFTWLRPSRVVSVLGFRPAATPSWTAPNPTFVSDRYGVVGAAALLSPGTQYAWSVQHAAPYATIDDYAGPDRPDPLYDGETEERTFTTIGP